VFLDDHHTTITVDLRAIFLVWKLRSTLSNIDADQPKQVITYKITTLVGIVALGAPVGLAGGEADHSTFTAK
jgi:hypothetical protein